MSKARRLLIGGPADGLDPEVPEGMDILVGVRCPFGQGDLFHLASALYDSAGHWVETRCTSTDGEPLVETASDTTAGQDGEG